MNPLNVVTMSWLEKKNKENEWCHDTSPLIWRETGMCGSKPVYIGGYLEYIKFINDYYGMEVALTETEIRSLSLDYVMYLNLIFEKELEEVQTTTINITILGAGYSVCPDLVAQLVTMKEFTKLGTVINLYDEPGHFFKLKDIVKDAMSIGGDLKAINTFDNLFDALKNCNILIALDDNVRDECESIDQWLKRNYESSKDLAEQINLHASQDIKVILCSMGPTCFCANVIVKYATKLNKHQVVAISAHYGLEMLYDVANSLNGIGCPPVWGFLGISSYVDIFHTVQRCYDYLPQKQNSCLSYLASSKFPYEQHFKKKSICMYQVGRCEDYQKCKAICDLLRLWYKRDEANIGDEIITLGVSSDGSFGIPKNVYFSQPVHLKILDDNSRVWVPCSEFPFPIDSPAVLKNLMETAQLILQNHRLID
ncbi:putative malate dehydrogenase 1B [Copidosoma floridanum]|uniref:putative malate dehydrogenase 1B n=1 Tax=Copidosoma floridanum TaxID=29053 RepID=UPI0006C95E37|nr:putative malate dehydrogenase 1B [Copidosoma floridanum]